MLIGCSGWSHEDWIGRFYPAALARRKEEWLRYYASFFNTVEVNSAFHRPPNEIMVKGWIRKGKPLKDFEYSLRMPRTVTHEAMGAMDGDGAAREAKGFERSCVRPVGENGLLGAVLLKLPSDLRLGGDALSVLGKVLGSLETDVYRYAVEFRHPSWFTEASSLDPGALEVLSSHNVSAVQVDGAGLPPVKDITADHVYVRFHGRGHGLLGGGRGAGSGYVYTEDELRPWTDTIERLRGKVGDIRVYFANNGRAMGARNAFQMMDMLSIPHREKIVMM